MGRKGGGEKRKESQPNEGTKKCTETSLCIFELIFRLSNCPSFVGKYLLQFIINLRKQIEMLDILLFELLTSAHVNNLF